jgi:toxin-antitoxin system PIN domain toxin
MRLVDANVLLYAVNEASAHHARSRRWLDAALNGQDAVGFPWTVILAFLRLSTHLQIFPHPLSPEKATAVAREWFVQPSALVVEPTPRHLDILAALLVEAGTAGNLVNDAHLAALAIEHDAVLVSFDADFGRFTGLKWETPGR